MGKVGNRVAPLGTGVLLLFPAWNQPGSPVTPAGKQVCKTRTDTAFKAYQKVVVRLFELIHCTL
jgi:hypothetical protein